MFGTNQPPVLEYSEADLKKLAVDIIRTHTTVTGVQPKLSLHLTDESDKNIVKKFTIVGLWGGYILKPPTHNYPHLPEVEDLTMHLAAMANINVCLLYTSDAADERSSVDLGGRRIIKKKKQESIRVRLSSRREIRMHTK